MNTNSKAKGITITQQRRGSMTLLNKAFLTFLSRQFKASLHQLTLTAWPGLGWWTGMGQHGKRGPDHRPRSRRKLLLRLKWTGPLYTLQCMQYFNNCTLKVTLWIKFQVNLTHSADGPAFQRFHILAVIAPPSSRLGSYFLWSICT